MNFFCRKINILPYEFNLFKLAMSGGGAYVTKMDFAGD
jgi:hypothetical protein